MMPANAAAHCRTARLVSSVPLSLTIVAGGARSTSSASSCRTIRRAGGESAGRERQALPTELADHVHEAKPPRIRRSIPHEVRPDLVNVLGMGSGARIPVVRRYPTVGAAAWVGWARSPA
jgi:hypothetical protein